MENIIKISEAFRIALVSSVTNSFLFEFQKKKKNPTPAGRGPESSDACVRSEQESENDPVLPRLYCFSKWKILSCHGSRDHTSHCNPHSEEGSVGWTAVTWAVSLPCHRKGGRGEDYDPGNKEPDVVCSPAWIRGLQKGLVTCEEFCVH